MTGPITIDASVLVRATNHSEPGRQECEMVMAAAGSGGIIVEPTLVLPELAGVLARRRVPPEAIRSILERIRRLPGVTFTPLDEASADETAELAIETRLRGADSVYVATARRYGATLVTVDEEQRVRSPEGVTAVSPSEFLASLEQH